MRESRTNLILFLFFMYVKMGSKKPKVSEQLFVEALDLKDEKVYFILDPNKSSWAFINKDSLEILNLCNGKNTIHDISGIIADKYAIYQKEALNGVESFLNRCFKKV